MLIIKHYRDYGHHVIAWHNHLLNRAMGAAKLPSTQRTTFKTKEKTYAGRNQSKDDLRT